MPTTADRLRDALTVLPIAVQAIGCRTAAVALDGYPDGPRPTSTVTLIGQTATGEGEYVGWTTEAHAAFDAIARRAPYRAGSHTLGSWCAAMRAAVPEPYARAALESAAVELALQQAGTSLATLAGVAARRPREVRSATPGPRPFACLDALGDVELKIDADPAWDAATWDLLAVRHRIAVVDFKGGGTPAAVRLAHRALPTAWLEDPPPGTAGNLSRRVSVDAPITAASTLGVLDPVPGAVNVKLPRLGGMFEALEVLAWCSAHRVTSYVGGMWEVGAGRRMARALAAIASPDGPNDVAQLTGVSIQ